MRLRGRENVEKRYLIQVAAMNLGLVMRAALGRGTPRQAADARKGRFAAIYVLWAVWMAAVTKLGERLATLASAQWLTAPIRRPWGPVLGTLESATGC